VLIVLDFDGTIVNDDHDYDDLATPLTFKYGAREALRALARAGHVLVLCSGRANRALRLDWTLNPLWNGVVPFDVERWKRHQGLNQARYQQMLAFVGAELPGIFAMVDDGGQGKVSGDLYVDDKALRYGFSMDWSAIAVAYGEPAEGAA
jgi:hypothetical protein